jgi:hypothetical protein
MRYNLTSKMWYKYSLSVMSVFYSGRLADYLSPWELGNLGVSLTPRQRTVSNG